MAVSLAAQAQVTSETLTKGAAGSQFLAFLWKELLRMALQPVNADHDQQCGAARSCVDPSNHSGQQRDYTAGSGRHDVYHRIVWDNAWAIDLLTGKKVWSYSEYVPSGLGLCCGTVNRGFALLGDRLFKVNIQRVDAGGARGKERQGPVGNHN